MSDQDTPTMQHRYSIIANGVVVQSDLLTDDQAVGRPDIVRCNEMNVGYLYDVTSGNFSAPPPAPPLIPASITRRQCARQMLAMTLITPAECLAMTKTGDAPSIVMKLINQLPSDQQILAQIDFAADIYARDNALLNQLMTSAGHSSAEIDAFFIAASGL